VSFVLVDTPVLEGLGTSTGHVELRGRTSIDRDTANHCWKAGTVFNLNRDSNASRASGDKEG